MKVKYALVHRGDYLNTELTQDKEELERIAQNKGLRFIRTFPAGECLDEGGICIQQSGPIDVYEVVAQPKEPKVEQ